MVTLTSLDSIQLRKPSGRPSCTLCFCLKNLKVSHVSAKLPGLMPPRRRKPPRAGALTELPPLKIVRSIVILQIIYYVAATVLILFTVVVAGQKFSINLIFDWKTVRGDNTIGWTLGLVWLLVGFVRCVAFFLLTSA